MRKIVCWTALLLVCAALTAQTAKPKPTAKPAAKPAPAPAAAPATAAEPLPTQQQLEAYFKRAFGYDQNLTFKVARIEPSRIPHMADATVVIATPEGQQVTHWFISSDENWIITGEVFPYGTDPYADNRARLDADAFGPTKGPKDAKFMIVEFADLECPACRSAEPVMERLQNDFPNVKFVFQSMPLEMLHPWALTAAKYLDCMQRANNEQAWTFLQAVYTHQPEIEQGVRIPAGGIDEKAVTERMNRYVSMAGGDPTKISACVAEPETTARVHKSFDLGTQLRVSGTPTLFVNGRMVSTINAQQYEGLKA
ncbi:MAG TPA: thioredoxin domain-containing protein, partial [Terriglobales bacterium]